MPRKKPDTARFERRYAPAVVGDLAVLRAIDARLVDAALAALQDPPSAVRSASCSATGMSPAT